MKYRVVVALCLAVNLAGCQLMSLLPEAKKMNYKSAGKLPPLEVPPDLTAPGSDERYVVPDINPSGSATFSAYSKDRTKQTAAGGASAAFHCGRGEPTRRDDPVFRGNRRRGAARQRRSGE